MLRCCWRPVVQLGRHYAPYRLFATTPKTPLSTRPVADLHAFLSPTNLVSKEPITYTPKALHKLYIAAKALRSRGDRPFLSLHELNELLVLFGSLSIPPPRPPNIYLHRLVSHIPAAPFQSYWPLVLELAEQIRVWPNRRPRTSAHHYWVMRAHLARMRSTPSKLDESASEATARYIRLRKNPDAIVHIPYLSTMLSLRWSTHLSKNVDSLCKVLDSEANPDRRFADLLWQIVLGEHGASGAHVQARVLATLWTRLQKYPYRAGTRIETQSRYAFDAGSKHHIRLGVSLPQLCTALMTALFPQFRLALPAVVSTWAVAEAKAVFQPQTSAVARWSNVVILALYAAPPALSAKTSVRGEDVEDHDGTVAWRTVFALALFDRTVPHDAAEPVRTAVRRLWRTWKDAEIDMPLVVRCVVVGAFLRLTARTRDGPLKDACVRYCITHALWGTHAVKGRHRLDVAQTTELFMDYVYATLHMGMRPRGDLWPEIFAALPEQWRTSVADRLFRDFLPQDIEGAQELYAFCEDHKIAISAHSLHRLGLLLARRYFPDDALHLLNDSRLSPDQVEELLDWILFTLRGERHPFRDVPLADVLLPVMERLYLNTDRIPKKHTKYSLRYALSVLADSGRPVEAATLLRVLHERRPNFFSHRYFLRMMRTLVKHRRTAAVGILRLVQRFPRPVRQNLRRKLTLRLARTGAHTLAEGAYRFGGMKFQRRTPREVLAKAVNFRVNMRDAPPPRQPALRIRTILARRPRDVPTVKYGVALLARVGRIRAAKRAVSRARAMKFDRAALTWLGNTVLNGALHRTKNRYARLVRHVLQNRTQLERQVGFVQDRVTVNILVKVLLRWKPFMDAERIRRLFDHMVRSGYPAPVRWRRENGVPFGTAAGGAGEGALDILKLSPFISFERHVRPLYRMFIKALHLQEDLSGARTVIGILHSVWDDELARRHARRRLRLAGILRKKARRK
ncbi:hypothetical protein DFH06DRAFT_1218870 [Mycena polygramma]|nr:hypothetical protein DFH06DRAFT_1218870 [Mycena polygramma]